MKKLAFPLACVALLLLTWFFAQNRSPIYHYQMSLSLQNALDDGVIHLSKHARSAHLKHRYCVLLYLTNTGCNTCREQAVEEFIKLRELYGESADFAVLSISPDDPYLKQLIRIKQIKGPVFIETTPTGLPRDDKAGIFFLNEQEVLGGYFPNEQADNAMQDMTQLIDQAQAKND